MRGYSVLFVCALCVFVLCGAAAVVLAQDVTPEKAAEAARAVAKTAKENGEKVLTDYKAFNSQATSVEEDLKNADTEITEKKAGLKELKTGEPSKTTIEGDVDTLAAKAKEMKAVLGKLKTADVEIFIKPDEKKKFTDKMTDVDNKMTEMETAAKAVTDETSSVENVITKAGALETAAGEASGLWGDAVGKLTPQLDNAKAAVDALTGLKKDIEQAVKKFGTNGDQSVKTLNEGLTASKDKLETPLGTITAQHTKLVDVKKAAEEAKKHYDKLVEEAKKVKQAAEKKKGTPQNTGPNTNALTAPTGASATQETEDYSAGPLCSLALPAFFFCWCVLFGV